MLLIIISNNEQYVRVKQSISLNVGQYIFFYSQIKYLSTCELLSI